MPPIFIKNLHNMFFYSYFAEKYVKTIKDDLKQR